jgi:Uma2 family endonuclease
MARLVTADELLRMPEDGYRYELVRGVLTRMSPPGSQHGLLVTRLALVLASFVERAGLGVVLTGDAGFRLAHDPDTVRGPDIAFIRHERIPAEGLPRTYWPGAPDLAVEVISSDDRPSDTADKLRDYLTNGVRAVWMVHPDERTATIHRPNRPPQVVRESETLEDEDLLPGFRCPLAPLFAPPCPR